MQLYIIRHAQSKNNALWLETGSSKYRNPDPLLTETGQEQVKCLARYLQAPGEIAQPLGRDPHNLAGYRITHLYCSLMLRAVETGLGISRALGLPLAGWRDIHETGGIVSGDGEEIPYSGMPGNTRQYFEENYPDLTLLDQFGPEGWWNRPFEEHPERRLRAKRVVQILLEKHGDSNDHVALVTHGAFYNHLMQELLGIENRQIWYSMSNTSITRWEFLRHNSEDALLERALDYTNRVDHLPAHLITP